MARIENPGYLEGILYLLTAVMPGLNFRFSSTPGMPGLDIRFSYTPVMIGFKLRFSSAPGIPG